MDELIDLLDENEIKIGKTATRKEVHKKGLWHRAIVVALINDNNQILLQQRSYNKEKNAGMWDISVAGHLSAGDTSKMGAIRELKEELNVDCSENELEYILTYKDQRIIREDFIENQFYDFYILKKNDIEISDIVVQESEVEQVKYIEVNELKSMIDNNLIVERKIIYDSLFKYISEDII